MFRSIRSLRAPVLGQIDVTSSSLSLVVAVKSSTSQRVLETGNSASVGRAISSVASFVDGAGARAMPKGVAVSCDKPT
jgi:hypothetical protein